MRLNGVHVQAAGLLKAGTRLLAVDWLGSAYILTYLHVVGLADITESYLWNDSKCSGGPYILLGRQRSG